MGVIGNDHYGLGIGVVELIFELTRGIKRIDVGDRETSLKRAKEGDRKLHQIRHHQGKLIARPQAQLQLQKRRKILAQCPQFRVSQLAAHIDKGSLRAILRHRVIEELN